MSRAGVLVTGATTPVGRALVARLLRAPDAGPVLAIGAEPPGASEVPGPAPCLTYRQVDLTRTRDLRTVLFGVARDLSVGTVVHAALHRRASDRRSRIHALNVESTRALLHLAERHPTIKRFCFRSDQAVYRVRCDEPTLISEEHPLDLSSRAPAWVRDRVEADLMVCARMGVAPLEIVVLRCAEILAPDSGSQLHDYLATPTCLRPLGFDPILNLLSVDDAARALELAVRLPVQGVFNVPGKDTLPLSALIRQWGCRDVPVPGPLLAPLYRLRRLVLGTDFRYDLNRPRFHFGGIADGRRARQELGYEPECPIDWRGTIRPAAKPATEPTSHVDVRPSACAR